MKKAWSLPEFAIVLTIQLLLLALAIPLFQKPFHDSQFEVFAHTWVGHLSSALSISRKTGLPMTLSLLDPAAERYRISFTHDMDTFQFNSVPTNGYSMQIQCALPTEIIDHPTTDLPLTTAFTSSHGEIWRFGREGSSSGTIVFSDHEGRSLCTVLSGSTGSARTFIWDRDNREWLRLF